MNEEEEKRQQTPNKPMRALKEEGCLSVDTAKIFGIASSQSNVGIVVLGCSSEVFSS